MAKSPPEWKHAMYNLLHLQGKSLIINARSSEYINDW